MNVFKVVKRNAKSDICKCNKIKTFKKGNDVSPPIANSTIENGLKFSILMLAASFNASLICGVIALQLCTYRTQINTIPMGVRC